MAIDPIGKGGGVTGLQRAGGIAPASEKKAFEVGGPRAVGEAKEVSPAERVRDGSLDVNEYVDLRVNEATKNLEGRLGKNDLESVRTMLRAQMTEDPALVEMIRAATGKTPPSPEGDDG